MVTQAMVGIGMQFASDRRQHNPNISAPWHKIETAHCSNLNSVYTFCTLLTALAVTFGAGCLPAAVSPDVVTDAPSAVDAPIDSVDVAEVRTCDLLREVNRIMADQSNVVDCGYLSVAQPAVDGALFMACVNDNVAGGRPVRAIYSARGIDLSPDIAFLSLRIGDQQHCVRLTANRPGPPYGSIRMTHAIGRMTLSPPNVVEPAVSVVFFQCPPGTRVDEGLPYDPPRTLPNNSTICP